MLHKSTTLRIAALFFAEPTKEHYLKDISRKTGIAHTSVMQQLGVLLKDHIIEKRIEIKGSRAFPLYRGTRNELFRFHKKMSNLLALQESGVVEQLREHCTPSCIVLFGSYSRGEDIEDSDIDLYVQAEQRDIELRRFERLLGRKIQIHWNETFAAYPEELRNNIINGIVLAGYLEAFQ